MADFAGISRELLREAILAARAEAARALCELETDTRVNLAANDLFKRVTGTSSMEKAILAARRIIESYDRILKDLEAGCAIDAEIFDLGGPAAGACVRPAVGPSIGPAIGSAIGPAISGIDHAEIDINVLRRVGGRGAVVA